MARLPDGLRLRNRRGTPVDPVPFLVVSLTAFTVFFTFGPIYLLAFGLDLPVALAICGAATAGAVVAAHHRYVRTARPDLEGEVPAESRLKRLVYGAFAATALMLLFALLLVAR